MKKKNYRVMVFYAEEAMDDLKKKTDIFHDLYINYCKQKNS
jgi:hypothetical protein